MSPSRYTYYHRFPSINQISFTQGTRNNHPPELRLLVWTIAASFEPRTVTLLLKGKHPEGVPSPRRRKRIRLAPEVLHSHTPSPIPTVLQATHESPLQSQLSYSQAFSLVPDVRYTYINFSIDTLNIPLSELSHLSLKERSQLWKLQAATASTTQRLWFRRRPIKVRHGVVSATRTRHRRCQ